MSKTDKTRPYWVKLLEESPERVESHNHEKGICDLRLPTASGWRAPFRGGDYCYYTVSYYGWNNGFYGRGSARWLKAEIRSRHGASRAKLRKDISEIKKLSREDIEDYDIINPRPRNGALWDWH